MKKQHLLSQLPVYLMLRNFLKLKNAIVWQFLDADLLAACMQNLLY